MTYRHTPRSFHRTAGPGILLVSSLLLLSACAGDDDAASGNEEVPDEVPEGTSLVIGDQQEHQQVILEASGELDELPFDHEFVNFVGGPEILEYFRSGSADVAWVGDIPPVHAAAAGEEVPIIFAWQTDPEEFRLAVSPSADVQSLSDLEGARIAYAEGTAQQAYVLKALDAAGLEPDDVELVRLQLNEFSEAVQTEEVDVAPLNEPRFTRYINDFGDEGAGSIPVEETRDLTTGLKYLYARQEVLDDPDKAAALGAYVEHYIRAHVWVNENQDDWIEAYYVDNQGVGGDDGEVIEQARGENVFPRLDEDLIAIQQETIDVIDQAGELPVSVDASEIFDTRFNDIIEETVEELGASHER